MPELFASGPLDGGAVKSVSQSIEAGEGQPRAARESALLRELRALREQVRRLAPDCLGMSVTWTEQQATVTLVASEPAIAVLDALQYLGGGPALAVVGRRQGIEADVESLLSEDSWSLFAHATRARGVRSILALPLTQHGRVVGTVTFHGATENAFSGSHERLADLVAAWAPGAIRLAEPMASGPRPEEQRGTLRDQGMVNRAVATIAAARGLDVVTTKELLGDAAARAGVSTAQVSEALLLAHH